MGQAVLRWKVLEHVVGSAAPATSILPLGGAGLPGLLGAIRLAKAPLPQLYPGADSPDY